MNSNANCISVNTQKRIRKIFESRCTMTTCSAKMKMNYNNEDFCRRLQNFWQADQYCDVVLFGADGNTKIPAHRVVLAAFSPYFAEQDENVKKIVVEAIDAVTLQLLVGACYSGTLEMDENNVSSLYMGAIHLQLNSLLTEMDNYIVTQLNESNCLHFYNIAEMSSRSVLLKAAENYICNHFIEISDHPSFLELDAKKLNYLLSLEGLVMPSVEDHFRNVVKWIQHDRDRQRDDCLAELLSNLKLSSMSPQFLLNTVKPHCKTAATNAFILAALETQFECTPPIVPVSELESKLESIPPIPIEVQPLHVRREQLITVAGSRYKKMKIMCYCFDRQKWNTIAKLPMAAELISVVHSKALNSLCIVGGHLNSLHTKDVILWNLETRKFTRSTSMLEPRSSAAVVSISDDNDQNGDLFVVGGLQVCIPLSTVECWSRKTRKFHPLKSIEEGRIGARLVQVGNLLYCIGGHNLGVRFKSVECYNLSKKRWSTVASLHHPRNDFAVMNDGGKVYVLGGGSEVIECYLPRKNKWIEVCAVKGSEGVQSCMRHNNRLVAVGCNIILISDGDWKNWTQIYNKSIHEISYGAFSVSL